MIEKLSNQFRTTVITCNTIANHIRIFIKLQIYYIRVKINRKLK